MMRVNNGKETVNFLALINTQLQRGALRLEIKQPFQRFLPFSSWRYRYFAALGQGRRLPHPTKFECIRPNPTNFSVGLPSEVLLTKEGKVFGYF